MTSNNDDTQDGTETSTATRQVKFDLAFACVLFMGLSVAFIAAWDWPFRTGVFPRAILTTTMLLAVIQIAVLVVGARRGVQSAPGAKRRIIDLPTDESVPSEIVFRRGMWFAAWFGLMYLLVLLFGFLIGVPLFIVIYLLTEARASVVAAAIYASAIFALSVGLFHYALRTPWPEPWILELQRVLLNVLG